MSIVFIVLVGLLVLSGVNALIALVAATSGVSRNTTGFVVAAIGLLCVYVDFSVVPYIMAAFSFLFAVLPLLRSSHPGE